MASVKEEVTKHIISSVFTISIAIGSFMLSASVKSCNDYKSMNQAVKVEARINNEILKNSFTIVNMNRKTVLRDFSVITIKSALANENFISSCGSVEVYFGYLLNLERMNGFKN